MSVLVAPRVIHVGGYCLTPLPAEGGRKGDTKPQLELLLETGLEFSISWADYHPSLLPQLV